MNRNRNLRWLLTAVAIIVVLLGAMAYLLLTTFTVTADAQDTEPIPRTPIEFEWDWPLPSCKDTPLTVRPKNRDVSLWHLWRCNYIITIMGDQRSRLGRTWLFEADARLNIELIEGCQRIQTYRGLKPGQSSIEPTNWVQQKIYIEGESCIFRLSAWPHKREWRVRFHDTCYNRSKCRWPYTPEE